MFMEKKDKKQKMPINALRKPLVSVLLGTTLAVGSLGMLTGCSGTAGKSAYDLAVENGFEGTVQEWLASLKAEAPTIEIDAQTKHWIVNGTDTGIKAEGVDAQAPTVTIDPTTKHWIINGTDTNVKAEGVDGEDGDPGETGNGIENIDVKYEFDNDGNMWAVTTITYTNAAPQQIRTLVPQRVEEIIGFAVGNILEVQEAIDTLKGNGPADFMELCLTLGTLMLIAGGVAKDETDAREKCLKVIKDGSALDKFAAFVASARAFSLITVAAAPVNADAVDKAAIAPETKSHIFSPFLPFLG